MAGVRPMDDDAYRATMAWSVLRRIKRRQNALRRRWYELSREEVEAELLAIAHELIEAAPLFLPRVFDSGAKATGSENGEAPSRNGRYNGAAERIGADLPGSASHLGRALYSRGQAPEATGAAHGGPEESGSASKRLLNELDHILAELKGEQPEAGVW